MNNNRPVVKYYWSKYSIIAIFLFVIFEAVLLLAGWAGSIDFETTYWFLAFGAFFVFGVTYSQTIVVDTSSIYVTYGVGLFSYEISLQDIKDFQIIPNRRLIPWFYNPMAENCLLIHFRSRPSKALAADDPRSLMLALKSSI